MESVGATQDEAKGEEGAVVINEEAPVIVASSSGTATLSPPSLPPMTKMQVSLMETLSDMTIRSEVQDCMNAMLMDVETTFYLRQELELQATRHAMATVTKHHHATILEANAEREARESAHIGLADQMVQEVMSLSKELEELLQWKRDHAHKVQEYDGLVAKLAQTEEELEATQQRFQVIKEMQPPQSAAVRKDETTVAAEESKAPSELVPSPSGETSAVEPPTSVAEPATETVAEIKEEDSKPAAATPEEEIVEDTKPAAEDLSTEPPAAAAVVTLEDDEPEEKAPNLVDMDVEVLMTVFGFLDAMDILNMAQINVSMYNKIDNIFGISEDGQRPPQPTPQPAPVSAARPTPTTPAPASRPAPAPATAPVPSTTPASGTVGNRLFNLLQPARTPGPSGKKPAVNANIVQSIASKLTDAEVAAILNMTDRVNKMEREVLSLRQERDAMAAKLDGTEAVKQFLISKVRDVETKLSQSREDEVKVTQQIASDQEVIAFLDSRVQELERQTETLTKDKSRATSELETTKVQTSKKITMLSDMLKYEREKLKDEESEWKATKKVLVKEVKSCRAQILALQAERDGLKEQNEMLKRAIVLTGKSPRSTSPMR